MLTRKGLQAICSVRSLEKDAKCRGLTCPKDEVLAGVPCDECSKRFRCACGDDRKDIWEPYFQYDKLSLVCPS